jgi:N-hydroxyarylamine O-acetyltransferase
VTGEWEIERLDLDAYLDRVEYDGDTSPTAQTLAALHRAHLATIPFENLDVVLGRGIEVDLDSVEAKLVRRRRGGYCFEHGVLFAAALERLGYAVDRLLARVGDDWERPRARTHMTLRVHADGAAWLADVGFGNGILEPLPFAADGPVIQQRWTFALAASGSHSWRLRERQGADWRTRYAFDDQRVYPADIVMANHFTSTFPRSPFVGQAVVVRRDGEATRRLVGRRLSVTRPDGSTEERDLGDDEVAEALLEAFRLPLSPQELAALPG